MSDLIIRPLTADDRDAWAPLWASYLAFYDSRLAPGVTDFTWQRLASGNDLHGFLAIDPDDGALGLVHFLYHASAWSIGGNCYLQDLFVVPAARGRGAGKRLIAAVVDAAKAKGAAKVYWQTEEFNGAARRVYERVAKRSPFILYEIVL